jgi:hypothetical protein
MNAEIGETAPWRRSVEVRLAMLERAGERCKEDRTEQRGMVSSMDADLSSMQGEFRAQRGLLQALHLTQQEHTATLRELTVGRQEDRQEASQRHQQVLVGFKTLIGLLDRDLEGESGTGRNPGSPQ